MAFGFSPTMDISAQEINSLEELEQYLHTEVRQFSEFESQLILELKEVRHMESNLKELEIQMKAVDILMKHYNDLTQRLYFEMHKKDNVDTNKCRSLMNMLNKIRSELGPLNNKMVSESEKLFLHETHKLYAESEGERNKMGEIDKKARTIVSKMILIDKQIKGMEEGYGQIVNHLNQLEALEKQNIPANKPIKGFHS